MSFPGKALLVPNYFLHMLHRPGLAAVSTCHCLKASGSLWNNSKRKWEAAEILLPVSRHSQIVAKRSSDTKRRTNTDPTSPHSKRGSILQNIMKRQPLITNLVKYLKQFNWFTTFCILLLFTFYGVLTILSHYYTMMNNVCPNRCTQQVSPCLRITMSPELGSLHTVFRSGRFICKYHFVRRE